MILRKRTSKAKEKLGDPYIDLRTAGSINGFINLTKTNVASRSLNLPFNLCASDEWGNGHYAEFLVTLYNIPSTFTRSGTSVTFNYYNKVIYNNTIITPTDNIFSFTGSIAGYNATDHTLDLYVYLDLINIPGIYNDETGTTSYTPNPVGRFFASSGSETGYPYKTINNFHNYEFTNLGFHTDNSSGTTKYEWLSSTNQQLWADEDTWGDEAVYAKDGTTVYFGIKNIVIHNGSSNLSINKFTYFDGTSLQINDPHFTGSSTLAQMDEGGIKFVMYPWESSMGCQYNLDTCSNATSYLQDDGFCAAGYDYYYEFGPIDNYSTYMYGPYDNGGNDIIRLDFETGMNALYFEVWSLDNDSSYGISRATRESIGMQNITSQQFQSDNTPWGVWCNAMGDISSGEYPIFQQCGAPSEGGCEIHSIHFRAGDDNRLLEDSNDSAYMPFEFYGNKDYDDYIYPATGYASGSTSLYQDITQQLYNTYDTLGDDHFYMFETLCSYYSDPSTMAPWSLYNITLSSPVGDKRYDVDGMPWQQYEADIEFAGYDDTDYPSYALICTGYLGMYTYNQLYNYLLFPCGKTVALDMSRYAFYDIGEEELYWADDLGYNGYIEDESHTISIYNNDSIYSNMYNPVADVGHQEVLCYYIEQGHVDGFKSTDVVRIIPYNATDIYIDAGWETYQLSTAGSSCITSQFTPQSIDEISDTEFYTIGDVIIRYTGNMTTAQQYYIPTVHLYDGTRYNDDIGIHSAASIAHSLSAFSYITVRIGKTQSATPSTYIDVNLYLYCNEEATVYVGFISSVPTELRSGVAYMRILKVYPTNASYSYYAVLGTTTTDSVYEGSLSSRKQISFSGSNHYHIVYPNNYYNQHMSLYLYSSAS